jgi:hypothetical protein
MEETLYTCSSCLCLYWQDYGDVANLYYQIFQMVGATRGNPHGFGEASGSNLPPPPPPPNMMPMETFLLAQADMMRQILQNQHQMNQRRNDQLEKDPRVATYAQFSVLKPLLFHEAEEPLEADAWLHAIEAKLDVLTSPYSEDRKVKFAAMYLRGPALLWWDHFKMMQPNGHVITWAEFKTTFTESPHS